MSHQDGAGPEHARNDPNAGRTAADARPGRKLVLFADGTGNAFTTQESSVWRLYEALDHTQPMLPTAIAFQPSINTRIGARE